MPQAPSLMMLLSLFDVLYPVITLNLYQLAAAHEYNASEAPEQHSSQLQKVSNGFHCKNILQFF